MSELPPSRPPHRRGQKYLSRVQANSPTRVKRHRPGRRGARPSGRRGRRSGRRCAVSDPQRIVEGGCVSGPPGHAASIRRSLPSPHRLRPLARPRASPSVAEDASAWLSPDPRRRPSPRRAARCRCNSSPATASPTRRASGKSSRAHGRRGAGSSFTRCPAARRPEHEAREELGCP